VFNHPDHAPPMMVILLPDDFTVLFRPRDQWMTFPGCAGSKSCGRREDTVNTMELIFKSMELLHTLSSCENEERV
jgi:hypothetical protein